jgi:hypothetical protein
MGYRITSDFLYDVSSSNYRDVGFSSIVSKLVDSMGHAVTLVPSVTAPPYQAFDLADGSGRQLRINLQAPVTFLDGLRAGRKVRKFLVSDVTDGTKVSQNQYRYTYKEGLLTEVVYPSSLGTRRISTIMRAQRSRGVDIH